MTMSQLGRYLFLLGVVAVAAAPETRGQELPK